MGNNREDHDRGLEEQNRSKARTNNKKRLRDIRDMINENLDHDDVDYSWEGMEDDE